VKLGAYHSLELEQQRAFTVHKVCWDVLDIERIKQATDPKLSADLAAVLIVVSGTGAKQAGAAQRPAV
jgi:protein pelota